jgi:hypothetical protein
VVSDQWSVIGDIQMVSIQGHQDLEVWKKAMDLVVACYRTSERFPKSEAYGLVTQLQRAAVSVPANIAEGQGRNHTKEFLNHLSIALWFIDGDRNTSSDCRET